MNENPNSQNGPPRFSLDRLVQKAPAPQPRPVRRAQFSAQPDDQAEELPEEALDEPVREKLDETSQAKPPLSLARRPVPVGSSKPVSGGPRDLSILKPGDPERKPTPLVNSARPPLTPRPSTPRFQAPPPAPQPTRPAPAPGERAIPAARPAPAPVSLPEGIQRGFPRPKPANGHATVGSVSAPAPAPATTAAARTSAPLAGLSEETAEINRVEPLPAPAERAAEKPAGAPFLEEVLDRLSQPPAHTAVLGICDDGLPVLFDLNDPAPGAILVASDDERLRQRLLRTLLQTSAVLNSPRSVQFLILSTCPAEWQEWMDQQEITRHCLGVEALPQRRTAAAQEADDQPEGSPDRWLIKLSGWADQRRSGSVTGPAVILIVDDLAAVAALEYDARVNFDWLVKEGPAVRIWPVVAMPSASAKEFTRWVRLFKTRLLGPAEDQALFTQLASDSAAGVDSTQFAVRVQDSWLKFRVPVLPDEIY